MSQSNNSILLIITGSIAAYKALDLISTFRKSSYKISVIMTDSAQEFITPISVSSLTGESVHQNLFSEKDAMDHIHLSRQSDVVVIAPATANIISKIANGEADDLATATILASDKAIFLAPAMNVKMWENKAVKANIATLKARGVRIIEPSDGVLACGEEGKGKMADVATIANEVNQYLELRQILKGKKVLITAGSTYEKIDPVRFIGNHSSGKQAVAIAQICRDMGSEVIFIVANITCDLPSGVEIVKVQDASEMLAACEKYIVNTDIAIMAAAVADYKVKNTSLHKIKKTASKSLTLELERNPDILAHIANHKQRPKLLIGFAAETENLVENAKKKLAKCDFVVANDVSDGKVFGKDENQVYFISANSVSALPQMSKTQVAIRLVEESIK
jgi:phosphopantothenoylcysteine decarboxylase/phosphopantothenate--cysteine ligase